MMAATNPERLQATFRALADPTRREIIQLLSDDEMTVASVASHFDMTRAAVKKHLVVLEEGRIVASRQQGRETLNRLNPYALRDAFDWLHRFDRFWDDRLYALHMAIDDENNKIDNE